MLVNHLAAKALLRTRGPRLVFSTALCLCGAACSPTMAPVSPTAVSWVPAATPSSKPTQSVTSACLTPPAGMKSWWDGDHVSGSTAFDILNGFNGAMTDISAIPGEVGNAFGFSGYGSSISASYNAAFSPTGTVSVVAWVNPSYGTSPVISQTILEQGTRNSTGFTSAGSWTSYNAANTNGSGANVGLTSGVFDGRYIYFTPYFNGAFSGVILRYDSTGTFGSGSSWSSYDAANTNGAGTDVGFFGSVFDGRYVYFHCCPVRGIA